MGIQGFGGEIWGKELGGACIEYDDWRGVYMVLMGNCGGQRPLGRPDVDGMIILMWTFRKKGVGVWTVTSQNRIGKGGGH